MTSVGLDDDNDGGCAGCSGCSSCGVAIEIIDDLRLPELLL